MGTRLGHCLGADSIWAMRSASRSFAILSSTVFAAWRSSFDFDHAQFKSLFFCHLRPKSSRRQLTPTSPPYRFPTSSTCRGYPLPCENRQLSEARIVNLRNGDPLPLRGGHCASREMQTPWRVGARRVTRHQTPKEQPFLRRGRARFNIEDLPRAQGKRGLMSAHTSSRWLAHIRGARRRDSALFQDTVFVRPSVCGLDGVP